MRPQRGAREREGVPRRSGDGLRRGRPGGRVRRAHHDQPRGGRRRPRVEGRRLRLQLRAAIVCLLLAAPATAWADDAVDFTTTWYQEKRQGGLGGLTVLHPQLDIGADVGESFTLDIGYAADAGGL